MCVALGAVLAIAFPAREAQAAQQCKPTTTVPGVDLNPSGDGTLNWGASGTGFAIIKATQGTSYTDSDFAANWAALKSANVVRGAYHFFDATVSGVDQANYFLQVVGTIQPGDLPPTLDIECPVAGDSNCLGNGSSGVAPASQITQAMNDFLDTVKTATGLTPIVYSFGSWFSDNGVDTTGLQNYPLWLADYSGTNCFDVPAPWTAATIWQFDSSGTVSGVNVDDDVFLGSAAQLTSFTGQGSPPIDGGAGGAGGDAGPNYGTCTVSTTGATGLCIDTAACAAAGGTSTPDFCPGPANIECCTGMKTPDAGAGGGGGTTHDAGGGAGGEGGGGGGGGGAAGNGGQPPGGGGAGNGGQPTPAAGNAGDGSRGCACDLATMPDGSVSVFLGVPVAMMLGRRRRARQ